MAFKSNTATGPAGAAPGLNVVLSGPSASPVTVTIGVGNASTAQSGVDYNLAATTLTFAPGQTSLPIPLTTIAQTASAANKTVVLTLSSPSGASLGALTSATYAIIEKTPGVGFTTAASSGPQSQNGSLSVKLEYSSTQTVKVNYAVTGGTAKNGTDYKLTAGTLTIAAGATTASIPITVIAQTINEPDKTIQITLSSPTNAVLGQATTVYTILNNNATVLEPSVAFTSATAKARGRQECCLDPQSVRGFRLYDHR